MVTRLLWTIVPTVLIEWGVLLLLAERRRSVLWLSAGMNIVTNAALNLYLIYHAGGHWLLTAAVGELLVTLAEGVGYYVLIRHFAQSMAYSVLCNAISLSVGFLIQLLAILLGINTIFIS